MISLSLFKNYLIVIILHSTHCRYSTLILLSLFDFNSRKNRNLYFVKTFLLCVRGSYYYYSMFIMRSMISLSLLDTYFNYSTLISLSLFDFDFHKNLNSYFSHIFTIRSIILLLLSDDHFTYSRLDV